MSIFGDKNLMGGFDNNGSISDIKEYEKLLKKQDKGLLNRKFLNDPKNRVDVKTTEKCKEIARDGLKDKIEPKTIYKVLAKILVEDDVVGFVISDTVTKIRITALEALIMCENKRLPDLCIDTDKAGIEYLKGRGGCKIQELPFEMPNSVAYKTDGTYEVTL